MTNLEVKFDDFELHHVLRRDNEAADALARLASSWEPPPPEVFVQDLHKPSIRIDEEGPAPGNEAGSGREMLPDAATWDPGPRPEVAVIPESPG